MYPQPLSARKQRERERGGGGGAGGGVLMRAEVIREQRGDTS